MAKVSPRTRTRRTFASGVLGLLGIGLVLYITLTASSGRLPGVPYTEVSAAFTNVSSLKVGDEVRENSVRIGKVASVTGSTQGAIVVMRLDGTKPVYADARAAIWDQSALARKFVELDPGHDGAGPLGGQTIPESRNISSADLDQLLDVFDPDTRNALTSSVRELGGGLAEHSQDLHDLLEHAPPLLNDLGQVSDSLSSPQADLPALLTNANQLVGAFNGHQQQISSLVTELNTTLQSINVDGGKPLQDTVKGLPSTLADARSALTALDQPLADTRSAMVSLRPGASSLAGATPDLRGVLREGVAPLNKVPGVAGQAVPAVQDLTTTFADARPLASRLSEGLLNLSVPLEVLVPYVPEIGTFVDRVESLVSTYTSPGTHGARLGVSIEGLAAATGGVLKDPLLPRNPYPAPGQADTDRATLLPGLTAGGGN